MLRTACEVIAERGFGHTRTVDIARAAGVSQALLFYHFGTKDELFALAFAHAARLHQDLLEEIERSAASPRERLRMLMRRSSPAGSSEGWRLWIDATAESMRNKELEQTSRRLDARGRAVLRGIIEAGVASGDFVCADPESSAWRIFALSDGLALQIHVHPKAISRRRATQLVRASAAREVGLNPEDL
ncbi:TetR family transcriptional regulator C-terminal domain-containing protein [Nonomuraea rhizosphaerae]|uniref:TetR family transcriptional regulator C-terminal domain-containing protein n=1 Tax=Nonomuraea rhizosphaerae TaxID=2665663 RepID=UPI001FEC0636|nr:TetR/AcrR family transcriptional regulator [Nonomuraea rhizosphaerae]